MTSSPVRVQLMISISAHLATDGGSHVHRAVFNRVIPTGLGEWMQSPDLDQHALVVVAKFLPEITQRLKEFDDIGIPRPDHSYCLDTLVHADGTLTSPVPEGFYEEVWGGHDLLEDIDE